MKETKNNNKFIDAYTQLTVCSIHDTFNRGFCEGSERKIPFVAKPEHIDWLDMVCKLYKEEYGNEIEYYFDKICFWTEKIK